MFAWFYIRCYSGKKKEKVEEWNFYLWLGKFFLGKFNKIVKKRYGVKRCRSLNVIFERDSLYVIVINFG